MQEFVHATERQSAVEIFFMEVRCFPSYTRLHWHWMTYSHAALEGKDRIHNYYEN